ncbi:isoprenylcysteine carboxylmethyltransferase family protein [Nocardioides seonyuensis]|uniref:Isoprenylcysteine carboxylmethyltransferase family protein n=1 Tax=Nocardioides seonyuensis TaxID=2518371 RepID=A0A4P7IIX1_9ACTN|nr:isoprenylcysteine carboxylmethyltransferase family protein [Nocardioides seonyuensis]QBX57294.1 isoprenylcysteine carboxylmethyltransferase family protein [Nocardioides seonyuensis]
MTELGNDAVAVAALAIYAVYLGVGFGLRTWLQWRRTGDTGWRGISGRFGSAEWWAGVLFTAALLAGVLGPVTALLGLEPVAALGDAVVQVVGAGVAVAGVLATFATQLAMGTSWRIGVDETERTDLVTAGPFGLVRNPIFTAMAATGLGLALMVPNLVALLGFALLLVALQLQVRVVEEPYLVRTHGQSYAAYAATVGRFIPGLGRATPRPTNHPAINSADGSTDRRTTTEGVA